MISYAARGAFLGSLALLCGCCDAGGLRATGMDASEFVVDRNLKKGGSSAAAPPKPAAGPPAVNGPRDGGLVPLPAGNVDIDETGSEDGGIEVVLGSVESKISAGLQQSRIVGGHKAAHHESFIYLLDKTDNGSVWGSGCGANLIAPRYAITAAHCLKNKNKDGEIVDRKHKVDMVYIGAHDIYEPGPPYNGGEKYEVLLVDGDAGKIIHPDYDVDSLEHDIALLRLTESSSHAFMKLSNGEDTVDSKRTVVGMGTTSYSGELSDEVLEAEVKEISRTECREVYGSTITDDMVCAYKKGKDSCQGDSGGPLMGKTASGEKVQVGVVSWGKECAKDGYPGVYSGIPEHMDWILGHICEDPSTPAELCGNGQANAAPTRSPTNIPTRTPTRSPTRAPTSLPTDSPTKKPTFTASQNTGNTCGICLEPVDSCPDNPNIATCDSGISIGGLCEGDGECDTDRHLNNCNGYDVYRRIDCGDQSSPVSSPTKVPTKSPTNAPTKVPTLSPTNAPTESSKCHDETEEFKMEGKFRDCEWVAKQMDKGNPICENKKKARRKCPQTCDAECD